MSHTLHTINSVTASAPIIDPDFEKRNGYQRSAEKLGSGTSGTVYKAIAPTGSPVAIKTQENTYARKEAENLAELQDIPAIVRIRDSFFGTPQKNPAKQKYHIVMEAVPAKDLFSFLDPATPDKRLTFSEIVSITTQLAYILDVTEDRKFVLFDLKCENLIYRRDCRHLTAIDLAGARKPTDTEGPIVTPEYIAPEYLLHRERSEYDRWSLGCLLFLLLTEKPFISQRIPKNFNKNIPNYVIQRIFQRIGVPPADYLSLCSYKSQYLDDQGKFLYPLNLSPVKDWRYEIRLAAAKKGWPVDDVVTFISVIERLLCYQDRISPPEIIDLPLFQRDIPVHFFHNPNIKCRVAVSRVAGRSQPPAEADITFDTHQAVPRSLFIPKDQSDEYFVTITLGETTITIKTPLKPFDNLDITKFQQGAVPTPPSAKTQKILIEAEPTLASSKPTRRRLLDEFESSEGSHLFLELGPLPNSSHQDLFTKFDSSLDEPPAKKARTDAGTPAFSSPKKQAARPSSVSFQKKDF